MCSHLLNHSGYRFILNIDYLYASAILDLKMVAICIRLQGLQGSKVFLSETPMSRACIFSMLHYIIVL